MKLLKTYLHNEIRDNCLSDLTVLFAHKDHPLDCNKLIDSSAEPLNGTLNVHVDSVNSVAVDGLCSHDVLKQTDCVTSVAVDGHDVLKQQTVLIQLLLMVCAVTML